MTTRERWCEALGCIGFVVVLWGVMIFTLAATPDMAQHGMGKELWELSR